MLSRRDEGALYGGLAMDSFEQLGQSISEFGARLRLVRREHWRLPTPCEEWDVRELVNHVVGGALRYAMLLHGATAEEVVATRALDHLGDDPVGSFERRAQEVAHAFREPGALLRTVHHPAGDRSGRELLELRITEFAVHAWDLARAIGADEQIDPVLVDELCERLSVSGTRLEQGGYFDPPRSAPDDAPPLARLLHLTGRRP
jgi:uncharacterized protein (TIGR03086 family)